LFFQARIIGCEFKTCVECLFAIYLIRLAVVQILGSRARPAAVVAHGSNVQLGLFRCWQGEQLVCGGKRFVNKRLRDTVTGDQKKSGVATGVTEVGNKA